MNTILVNIDDLYSFKLLSYFIHIQVLNLYYDATICYPVVCIYIYHIFPICRDIF